MSYATWKRNESLSRSEVHLLTNNDAKVLGRWMEKRRQKTQPTQQFHTHMFKTQYSNWTPVVHKPSNNQIFKERKELVINWFDLWTDAQRKEFINQMMSRCERRQLVHVHEWFDGRVPLRYVDMTRVLPRFLSLYILSFLDPQSLSRAAQVSWHWKFLLEQDILWAPKCLRQGWVLPFTPSTNEYGAWKSHYIACALTLDNDLSAAVAGKKVKESLKSHVKKKRRKQILERLIRKHAMQTMESQLSARPMWLPPDRNPKDLELSQKALLADYNPNDPHLPPGLLLLKNKFGLLKTGLRHSAPDFRSVLKFGRENGLFEYDDEDDLSDHNALNQGNENNKITEKDYSSRKDKLSASLRLESLEERRMMELVGMPAESSILQKQYLRRRPDLSCGADYPAVASYGSSAHRKAAALLLTNQNKAHPRVVIISSAVPAAEVLCSSVLCGNILITYPYDSATCETILYQLKESLQGKTAESIALVLDCTVPDELRLTRDLSLNIDNISSSQVAQFFESLTSHILAAKLGGTLDIFTPLHSCESGSSLVKKLSTSTGMTIRTPCGISSDYRFYVGEWSGVTDGSAPSSLYFCSARLQLWLITARRLDNSCRVANQLLSKFLDGQRREITAQVIGNAVFNSMSVAGKLARKETAEALLQALTSIPQQNSTLQPLEALGKYLVAHHSADNQSCNRRSILTGSPAGHSRSAGNTNGSGEKISSASRSNGTYFEEETSKSPNGNSAVARTVSYDTDNDYDDDFDDDNDDDDDDDDYSDEVDMMKTTRKSEKKLKSEKIQKISSTSSFPSPKPSSNGPQKSRNAVNFNQNPSYDSSGTQLTGVNRRKMVANELLATEKSYLKKLMILESVFHMPLQGALVSNRAIISSHNVTFIFQEIIQLVSFSRDLVASLEQRLVDWSGQQRVGDLLVKFCSSLRIYSDYVKNYPLVLSTVEKCCEQSPVFRSFVYRKERTLQTGMLTLAELLLAPMLRAQDYVSLISNLKHNTPSDHIDCEDIDEALKKFVELTELIEQTKLRCERERKLIEIQRTVVGCPILSERNRFFIMQIDVACMDPPLKSVIPELRVYRYKETVGFILFNDALVITKRSSEHVPFALYKEHTYKFTECIAIQHLSIDDIPDSKYLMNAFRMHTFTKEWICCCESTLMKLEWMEAVDAAVRSSNKRSNSSSTPRFLSDDSDE